MDKDEALKLALEALRKAMQGTLVFDEAMEAFTAIKTALAQPAQEPVATISITQRGSTRTIDNHFADCVSNWPEGEYKLVLAAPPKREWVGLTEEEAYDLSGVSYNIFAIRAIEKALQEKNT